jgi:hypothetical protein
MLTFFQHLSIGIEILGLVTKIGSLIYAQKNFSNLLINQVQLLFRKYIFLAEEMFLQKKNILMGGVTCLWSKYL